MTKNRQYIALWHNGFHHRSGWCFQARSHSEACTLAYNLKFEYTYGYQPKKREENYKNTNKKTQKCMRVRQ